MAPTLSTLPDNNLGRIILNAQGLNAGGTYTIQRQSPGGAIDNVRNAEPLPGSETAYVVNDWEAPPNTGVSYRILELLAGVTTIYPFPTLVQWALGPWPYNCRLLHPTVPALSVKAVLSELSELTRAVRTEMHYPLGRPDPIVVAQVRQFPTGTVQFLTLTDAERVNLLTLLTQASVFCLQTPAAHSLAGGNLWFAALDLIEKRSGAPFAQTALRIHELAFAQVGRPPGVVSSALSSWADVVSDYATWADLVAARVDWNAVVLGSEVNPAGALEGGATSALGALEAPDGTDAAGGASRAAGGIVALNGRV